MGCFAFVLFFFFIYLLVLVLGLVIICVMIFVLSSLEWNYGYFADGKAKGGAPCLAQCRAVAARRVTGDDRPR